MLTQSIILFKWVCFFFFSTKYIYIQMTERRENESERDYLLRLKSNEKTRLWQNYMYKHDAEFRTKKLIMVKRYQRKLNRKKLNIFELWSDRDVCFTINFN